MKEMDYFENLGLDERRILKRIMNKHDATNGGCIYLS
jgi:hypothetical protein